MKRIMVFCILLCMIMFASCAPKSNYSVEEFESEYSSNIAPGLSEYEKNRDIEFFDITPDDIRDKIGCQIFKDGTWASAYVVYKDEMYLISESYGGLGIVDMELCDYNNDGQADIIYSTSWGSGIHRWEIGLFDFTTMTDNVIFSSFAEDSALQTYMHDICFEKTENNEFDIYTIKMPEEDTINFAKLQYTKDKLIGKIINEKNMPEILLN